MRRTVTERGRGIAAAFRRVLLPPAGSRATFRDLAPVVGFVVGFPLLCALLVRAGIVDFGSLTPFAGILLAPWIGRVHRTGRGAVRSIRSTLVLGSRLLALGLLIAILADPRAVRSDDRLTVMYVVDHSASITQPATDAALSYVLKTAAQKPEHDEVGLAFFGRDAAIELPPAMSLPFEAINVAVDRDGSDLARALSLAAAMLPHERPGRIVLVSDGVSTGGDLEHTLGELSSRGIAVDVLGIDYDLEREVWLERLELPREVRIGETFDASVVLESLGSGTGTLVLTENGQQVFSGPVEFGRGKNRFTVPIHMRSAGYYEYEAQIHLEPGQDGWERNNRAMTFLYLRGEGRILLVTDPERDPRSWAELERALVESERLVDRISGRAFPRSPHALLPYDLILFADAGRHLFDEVQVQAAHDAVFEQGIGLLMVGGEGSFGPGGWHRSAVEDALPVSMDLEQRKVLPKGALAIVLHTCEFPEGNTWGKRITKQAMRVLSAEDEVGVLIYDAMASYRWLFDLTSAGRYEVLAKLVNNAQIGDMPDFQTTMTMGLTALRASDAATKHMIIVSDGDPQPPPPQLLRSFANAKISVTTISVFPHGGQDEHVMASIAELTGGRYYAPKDPQLLPSIFIKEAKTLRRSMIQEVTFTPTVTAPSQVLKGIPALPPVHGYVLTTPKARALTVLDGPEEGQLDPVLAVWRYGLGSAAAFTSDLAPAWCKEWVDWDGYRAFVHQLTSEVQRAAEPSDLRVRSYAAGDEGIVVVDDHAPDERLIDVHAAVRGPDDLAERVQLRQVAPRRYVGRFPLSGTGRYELHVAASGTGADQRALGGFVVPYSREYLRFRADPVQLDRIAAATGGRRLNGQENGEELFGARSVQRSTRSIAAELLAILACWLVLDVALRRIQLDRATLLGWLRPTATPDATLGSLLERKRAVRVPAPPPREDAGPAVQPPAAAASRRAAPAAPPQRRTEVAAPTRGSTTARLLAAKRRRAGGDHTDDPDQPTTS